MPPKTQLAIVPIPRPRKKVVSKRTPWSGTMYSEGWPSKISENMPILSCGANHSNGNAIMDCPPKIAKINGRFDRMSDVQKTVPIVKPTGVSNSKSGKATGLSIHEPDNEMRSIQWSGVQMLNLLVELAAWLSDRSCAELCRRKGI